MMFSLRQTFFIAVVFSAVMQSHSDLIPPQLSVYQTTKYFICISINHQFNFSTVLWIFLLLLYLADEKSHPLRLPRPSRDESYFSAHSAKKSPLLNPWPSGFLPLPFRRRKRGTGLVNPVSAFVRFILAAKPSALARRSLSAFAGLRAPRPRLKQGTEAALTARESVWIWSIYPCRSLFSEVGRGFIFPAINTHFSRPQSAFLAFFSACFPLIV